MKLYTLFLIIFAISGFSGIIYESIWSHYLKLFLGHAAYAQTLVLAIFMGGMAIGSWICSRYSHKWKNPIRFYAMAEGGIGILALPFHSLFQQGLDFAYLKIIPDLGSPGTIYCFKWILSAFMIFPQSVLLGMTFPLMSAGMIRLLPETPGSSLAILYFTNSLGATIGLLVSGFVLIKTAGLPGTIMLAGILNILIAMIVWILTKEPQYKEINRAKIKDIALIPTNEKYNFFLFASLITGTASFIYEIGWIRMLCLVLGSSTHAFELMLSAFISGLAFGGLWIKGRIEKIGNPFGFLAWIQVIMGVLALSTLPIYGNTFKIMQFIITSLERTDSNYTFFLLSSHIIASIIMFPATFCAGMTLPLITFGLIKSGFGERSIGAVYAWNTVGGIIGVFFAIHIGMPFLGLKGLLSLGASLDISLGIFLAWKGFLSEDRKIPAVLTLGASAAVFLTFLIVRLDPYKMASGVYRYGRILSPSSYDIIYHRDGKTATVDLIKRKDGHLSLRINGKADAGINMIAGGSAAPDEGTMILAGSLPLALHPDAKTVANIGLGSGLTTHVLLTSPHLKEVDTVEIESSVVEASMKFGQRVNLTHSDPRSKIFIDDAKTFFSSQKKIYDIIVSEPSNPWVSGISSLFSKEFYRLIRNYLNDAGLFVQWLQLYEINMDLVASVFKAISPNFCDYVIYAPDDGNILIVAKKGGNLNIPDSRIIAIPRLAEELKRMGINNLQDLELRKIGYKSALDPLFKSYLITPNSDYFPVLDLNTDRTRFLNLDARELVELANYPIPVLQILDKRNTEWEKTEVTLSPYFSKLKLMKIALIIRDYFMRDSFNLHEFSSLPEYTRMSIENVNNFFKYCHTSIDLNIILQSIFHMAISSIPYLTPHENDRIWQKIKGSPCYYKLSEVQRDWIELFRAIGKREAPEMVSISSRLLKNHENTERSSYREYLLISYMLGNILIKNCEESINSWIKYSEKLSEDKRENLIFRLLVAHFASKKK